MAGEVQDYTYYPETEFGINAKKFGAVGDGVTDDTSALSKFIAYIQQNNKKGFIPAGIYKITSTLNFSQRPAWSIRGAGMGVTTIKMFTDNTPILNLGSDNVSFMNHFDLGDFTLIYNNTNQSGNTSANPILISQEISEGSITNISFDAGYYGIRVVSGIGGPWGIHWDNLIFGSNLNGGAMDWSQCVNSVPNNHFGRMFVTGTNMIGSSSIAIFDVRGYNFRVDTIEFINVQGSKTLFRLAAGGRVSIGTMKLENGTYNSGTNIFLLDIGNSAAAWATIDHFTMGGNNMVINNNTSVYVIRCNSEGVRAGLLDIGTTAALAGGSFLYVYSGNTYFSVDIVKSSTGFWTGLQNSGSTTNANFITVRNQLNHWLSDDKGDTSYTVNLGDPNKIAYQTVLTAPRTVTLPTAGNLLFNGLYYEVIVGASVATGTNTLTVMAASTTLLTITTGKVVAGFTWRRNAVGSAGWVLTKYETLP